MRRGAVFAGLTAVQLTVLAALGLHGRYSVGEENRQRLQEKRSLVTALQLTDLAIWTEARYTRHPSQTDFFSPFQDFPSSFEHFPAGSILAPARNTAAGGAQPHASPEP